MKEKSSAKPSVDGKVIVTVLLRVLGWHRTSGFKYICEEPLDSRFTWPDKGKTGEGCASGLCRFGDGAADQNELLTGRQSSRQTGRFRRGNREFPTEH